MKRALKMLFSYFALIVSTVIAIFPLIWVLLGSLKNRREIFAIPPRWLFIPTLANYKEVLLRSNFWHYFTNSIVITLGTVFICLILGAMGGYALSRYDFRSKNSLMFFIISTRMAPPVGFILSFFIALNHLNLIDTRIGLIIVSLPINLSFVIWMMKGFFDEIPSDIDEAARIDGCSTLRAFIEVVLPLQVLDLSHLRYFRLLLRGTSFSLHIY